VPCFWEFIAILFFTVIAGHEPQSVYAMMFVPVFYFLPSLRATTPQSVYAMTLLFRVPQSVYAMTFVPMFFYRHCGNSAGLLP